MADPGARNGKDGAVRRLRRRSPLLLALLAALLLVLVAFAAAEDWAFLESRGESRIVVPDTPFPLAYVAMAAIAILIACVLALRLGEQRSMPRRRSRGSLRPLAVALALLAFWVMFPPLQSLVTDLIRDENESGQTQIETDPRRETEEGPASPETQRSRPLGWAVIVAFVAAILAVFAALIVLLRQNPGPPPTGRRRTSRAMLEELEASEMDLRTIDDPRAAVIACYSRMQKAVTASGVNRRESDTPFELLERLAVDGRIPHSVARRLTELFETAKFSLRPVDESMRMQALDCLGQARQALESEPA
jgi:hypothetical protein